MRLYEITDLTTYSSRQVAQNSDPDDVTRHPKNKPKACLSQRSDRLPPSSQLPSHTVVPGRAVRSHRAFFR